MATFRQMQIANQKRLDKLIDQGGVKKLKKLYEQAQNEFTGKMVKRFGTNAKSFSAAQMRMFQAMVRQGQMQIAKGMGDVLAATTEASKVAALKAAIKDFKQLEKKFTGIATALPAEEAARFAGVLGKNTSLVKKHSTHLMGKAGVKTVRKIEQELALSLMTGETISAAIDRVQKIAGNQWYQAERIVRTEQAWAFNATHADAIADAADELPDIMMRWTELVDDRTGKPLDDRVAKDSLAMHGQVAPPGGRFTMPNKSTVPVAMWGKSWDHPPNRPNDRATLQPWRPHWGIPGWILKGGKRVSLAKKKR